MPLLVAALVRQQGWAGWKLFLSWIVWLVFLPNSFYIITDLIHLRGKSTLPWFDLILIFNFALAGLLAGVLSLEWIEKAVAKTLGKTKAILLSVLSIGLSGVGVLMGRDWRLNSKEIFTEPWNVVQKITTEWSADDSIKIVIDGVTFGVFYAVLRSFKGSD